MSEEILKARARKLAQPPQQQEGGETIEVVEFVLAGETYAVESAHVREVYSLKQWTPVPCAPPFVLGIINVRGQILTVLDIRKFFDLPLKELGEDSRVIIARSAPRDGREVGLLVDEVLGVRCLPHASIGPAPSALGARAQYLQGVSSRSDGGWVAVLEVAKILGDERIVVREEVGA
jgi:purine-binding chemotaxis protein CheW